MFIAKTINEIRDFLSRKNIADEKIILVPTMGSLHKGHITLVKKAKELSKIVVVSIFVNRCQFNDLMDYEKYPRQVENDLYKLQNCGVSCVFIPDDAEIFLPDSSFKIIPNSLTNCLCGKFREGHFEGVSLIIAKLFNIIKPNIAIFGEKDFQQVLVIKKMVRDLNFDVKIITQETIREKSGLAMSSRNQKLTKDNQIKAANIFRILLEIKKNPTIIARKYEELLEIGFEKIDYLEIRDEENLNLITIPNAKNPSRIFIAVYLAGIRLIDNISA
jgi:pantoate--beta-alanine ligase